MKNRINLIIAFVLGIACISRAQSIPLQVINSAGGGGTVSGGVQVYYNIGETVIATTTGGSSIVTQGFLQPDIIGKFGLTAQPLFNGVSCLGKTDGFIAITASVSGVAPTVQSQISFNYYWSPSTVCPTNDCATVNNLVPGTYSVLVVSNNGTLSIPSDSVKIQNIVITDNTSPCLIVVYNGLTPNHDGHNDYLHIDNIEQYPQSEVDIYNRWGQQLSHIEGYDNMNKRWNGTLSGSDVLAPTGTYFYVIKLDEKTKPIKGWIELLHE